jgi:hypothetical protein
LIAGFQIARSRSAPSAVDAVSGGGEKKEVFPSLEAIVHLALGQSSIHCLVKGSSNVYEPAGSVHSQRALSMSRYDAKAHDGRGQKSQKRDHEVLR